jgi:glycosyltransferase involved in cell wall biosynthesis
MRILIATGIFKPEVGGPATVALELARQLQITGHIVTVVTYSDSSTYEGDHKFPFRLIRIARSHRKLVNYVRYFFVMLKEMRKHGVVYSLDWFSAGFPVMLAAMLTGKKYIVRVGGGYIWEKYLSEGNAPLTMKEFYAQGFYKKYKKMFWIIKKVLGNAAVVIFNSDIQRELYIPIYNLDPKKTMTIYNATPENKLSSLVHSYNDTSLNRDKEIVYAGRFTKVKNTAALVSAFALLKDESFKLLLIGEGETETDLKNLVEQLGIQHRVEFMPPMSQSDLYYRIAHCYLVVIPSWTDISPNHAYECLALGIPILITQETYLSIAPQFPLMIDPHSISDIAEKLNYLLDREHYVNYIDHLKSIRFDHPWKRVVEEHLHVFMKINRTS